MRRRWMSNGLCGMRTVLLVAVAWAVMTGVFGGRARARAAGPVVFEEDFESAQGYKKRWRAAGTWRVVQQRVAGKQTSVLDVVGGGVGLSVAGDLGDYEFEADFRIVKGFGAFVLRARDGANLYFIQFGVGKRYFCPHTVRGGKVRWVRVAHERPIPAGAWRRVRVEVRGQTFRVFVGQVGQAGGKLELLGRWEGKADLAGGHWGFRCAAGEQMQVDNVRITAAGPVRAELSATLTRPRLPAAGRPFDLRLRAANRGWAAAGGVSVKLRLPEGVRLAEGQAGRDLGDLATGQAREAVWRVVAQGGASGKVVATVSCEGQRQAAAAEMPLRVLACWPALPGKPPARSEASVDKHGNVLLANGRVHLVVLKGGKHYVGAALHAWDGSRWRQLAVSQPLGRFACRVAEGDFEQDILPDRGEVRLAGGKKAAVRLTGEQSDGDGAKWQFGFTCELDADATAVAVRCTARADRDRQLLFFQGPELLAGEGSFGSGKDFALFGGLECLEGAEQSSSSRDMVPAVAARYAPHPYKVTVPVMAVQADGCVTAVMWDPLQKWDGKQVAPSARFASPNRDDPKGEANHRLGLFVPGIPKYVPENHDRAARAYPLRGGREIAVSAHLLAEAGAGVLDAIDRWFALYGLPKPKPPSESYDQVLAKCRVGYMKTMWDAKVVGTKHWDGGPARAYPNACAILWADAAWCGDRQIQRSQKERVRQIVAAAMKRGGEAALVDPIDTRAFGTLPCHIRNYFLPLQIGHLAGGLAAWRRRIYTECIATQRADGTWPVAGRAGCRQGEQVVSGTIAELAGSLLLYARVTADARAKAAGLKALRRLEKLPVPRGAQVWEVPKFTPDILASGHALWACLEAWQVTGERRHLDQAVHWARTGLPFVYMWQAPNAPLMKYGTIAVFGATHYRGAWFGRPVQWCGLVYGYWLLRLAEHDDRGPWRRIGQGIVDNGIQQMLDLWRKYPGTYTDWIDVMSGAICAVKFEPENLMKPILLARRQGVEVRTKILRVGPGRRVHVSTAARLNVAAWDAGRHALTCEIELPAGETSYAIVAGAPAPQAVVANGRPLARTDKLDAVKEGWQTSADALVLVKLLHDRPVVRLGVTFGPPR